MFLSAAYPLLGFEARAQAGATRQSVNYDVEFNYEQLKVGSSLNARTSVNQPGDAELNFKVFFIFLSLSLVPTVTTTTKSL